MKAKIVRMRRALAGDAAKATDTIVKSIMREAASRKTVLSNRTARWIGVGVVLALCCAPLFIGLGAADLENDEAIYSFAVDRMLESGDWLTPKSSPHDDWPFLEKPPLKMWIVAAPIRLHLLPHDEFGLRFWDAVFGGAMFVYVFLLATRLSNVAGGIAAALMLFVHRPVLESHGLRTNNMEAAVMLCYAGGIYHFLAWRTADAVRTGRRHVHAVGLFFVLGFMTKFVAALFLPLVMVASAALDRGARQALLRDWRMWAGAALFALALIAPWFVYEHVKYGSFFWQTLVGVHVYKRFTAFLDPNHVQPWFYYFAQMYEWLQVSESTMLVAAGLVLLIVEAVRRRFDALVVLLWFALPMALISFGTSKLYHYAYPFLPPLAIGAGAVLADAAVVANRWLAAALAAARDRHFHRTTLRTVCTAIAIVALAVSVATLVRGPISIAAGGRVLFKNGSLPRPWLVLVLFGLLGGQQALVRRVAIPLVAAGLLPLSAYRDVLGDLPLAKHPLRSASQCVAKVERAIAAAGGTPPGLYVDASDDDMLHPDFYYFRRIRPWERAAVPASDAAAQYLNRPGFERPVLIADGRYRELVNRGVITANTTLLTVNLDRVLLLVPGPYAACGLQPPANSRP